MQERMQRRMERLVRVYAAVEKLLGTRSRSWLTVHLMRWLGEVGVYASCGQPAHSLPTTHSEKKPEELHRLVRCGNRSSQLVAAVRTVD